MLQQVLNNGFVKIRSMKSDNSSEAFSWRAPSFSDNDYRCSSHALAVIHDTLLNGTVYEPLLC